MSLELLDHVVSGALYDFGGFLTTREQRVVLSGSDEAGPCADAIKEFLTLRGVDQECTPMTHDWPYRCSMLNKPQPSPCSEAMKILSDAMKADPMYAWSWHCNIAMAAIDEGAPRDAGNAAAARFMYSAFGVDTSKAPSAG